VGELTVAAVGLAPLVEQRQDLGLLLGQQPMRRRPARRFVGQLPAASPTDPTVRPHLAEFELVTDPAHRPAGVEGLVEQVERPALVAASTRRDSAT
jgi:hypothetical protein